MCYPRPEVSANRKSAGCGIQGGRDESRLDLRGSVSRGLGACGGFASAAVNFSSGSEGGQGQNKTYLEDGLLFSPSRLVNGNCINGSCLAFNKNDTTVIMTSPNPPPTFSLTSLWVQDLGQPSFLQIAGSNGVTRSYDTAGHNSYFQLLFTEFTNVSSITLTNIGQGNIRIDDIAAIIPLPSAAGLIAFAIFVLGWVSRRGRAEESNSPNTMA